MTKLWESLKWLFYIGEHGLLSRKQFLRALTRMREEQRLMAEYNKALEAGGVRFTYECIGVKDEKK